MKRFIIKIQVSYRSSEPTGQQTLVYNKDQTICYQEPTTLEILAIMNGQLKAYFSAHMVGTTLAIDGPAPNQDW